MNDTKLSTGQLPPPVALVFDWHGTLVNTLDAMYQAIEDMLPRLEELGLVSRLIPEAEARNKEDQKLIRYMRIFRRLHPKILAEQRISRTDIFDALFGEDEQAKATAHAAYNQSYQRYYGDVYPFQDGIHAYLETLAAAGLPLAVATNRSRVFFDNELARVDEGRWQELLGVACCGDEVAHYKPAPDVIREVCDQLGLTPSRAIWYIGDSTTDMLTARSAGIGAVFYNTNLQPAEALSRQFVPTRGRSCQPDAVVDDFEELLDLVLQVTGPANNTLTTALRHQRPARLPPRQLPPARIEPDWHPAVTSLAEPTVVLFDWHATLVDTLDAMYRAVDDVLPELGPLQLIGRLVPQEAARSPEDQRLVAYVRDRQQLHPKIKADRKISRTDIFEVLFGDDEEAKRIAHQAFNRHYRKYFGQALPFEPQVRDMLRGLNQLNIPLGVITNRDREFFMAELANVDGQDWSACFATSVCGDDTARRKPHPDQLQLAVQQLGHTLDASIWYVGDSTTDTIAAKTAGITSVFFNGAQWDQPWLNKIFPGNTRYPYRPDVVVNDFSEFWALVLACRR